MIRLANQDRAVTTTRHCVYRQNLWYDVLGPFPKFGCRHRISA